jgi:hypothetical protein
LTLLKEDVIIGYLMEYKDLERLISEEDFKKAEAEINKKMDDFVIEWKVLHGSEH